MSILMKMQKRGVTPVPAEPVIPKSTSTNPIKPAAQKPRNIKPFAPIKKKKKVLAHTRAKTSVQNPIIGNEAKPDITADQTHNAQTGQTPVAQTGQTRITFVPSNTTSLRAPRVEPLIPGNEKSFDVREDVRRGRPGRRSAVPGTKRTRKITVNISSAEYVAIVAAAEDQGISTSTLGRLAIFDAYGVKRPHPEKVLTVAQKRRKGASQREKATTKGSPKATSPKS